MQSYVESISLRGGRYVARNIAGLGRGSECSGQRHGGCRLSDDSKNGMWSIAPVDAAVEAEILALPDDMQARLLRILDLLTTWGPQRAGMPYTRSLGGKLWEIRLQGRSGIARVIYVAASGRRIVLLHAFEKKTQKTPRAALDTAVRRARRLGLT